MCPRSSASSSRPSSLTTAPSTIARPASGSRSPTMHLRVTLFPEPEYPMMTVFSPSGTSSVTPSRTRRSPKDFVRPSSWIMKRADGRMGGLADGDRRAACSSLRPFLLPPFRPSALPPSQQNQRPERVEHQDRLTAQDYRAGGGLADPLRPALGVQAPHAPHERDGRAEAGALEQPEPDVLEPIEHLQALE